MTTDDNPSPHDGSSQEQPTTLEATGRAATGPGGKLKLLAVVLVVSVIAILSYQYREELSLESLAERQSQFEAFKAEHPVLIYGVAFVIYVVVTALSLPGALPMTLIYGWLFRIVPAVILVSFASTLGATLAFLLSRYLLRDTIQAKFGDRLARFNNALEREGAFYLFTLRLIPAVPFFVINVVMGLTPIRARTFWWISQIGMLPGTAAFVYAGSAFPSLEKLADEGAASMIDWKIFFAFAVLGVLPLAIKKIVGAVKARRSAAA